jgi:hypothetical protein
MTTLRHVRWLLEWRPGTDGRLVMLAALAAYLGLVAVGRLTFKVDLWPWLGVPSAPSLFIDTHNLTAAWECRRLGFDPLYENPCDPQGRPLNYTRAWLVFVVLGLDQSHTVALAILLVAGMFLMFGILLGRVPAGSGIVLAAAVCSPAIMLSVERANLDVALFSLVALSAIVWRSWPSGAAVVSPMLVLAAAVLKVYGVFALPAFVLTRQRTAARTALVCVGVFAVYAALTVRDIVHIAKIAPQGVLYSYGARILPAHVYHLIGPDHWAGPAILKQLIAGVPLAVLTGALALRVRRRYGTDPGADNGSALLALHLGTLIFLGTFAAGNNFDYRLVFLLLTFPQLLAWARTPTHRLSSLAVATLLAILVLLWVGSLSEMLALWDEIASWIAAGLLAAVGAATLPPLRTLAATLLPGRIRSAAVSSSTASP